MDYKINLPVTYVTPTEICKTIFERRSFYIILILQVLILSIYLMCYKLNILKNDFDRL